MQIKNKTILLVEDEQITALMGRKVLENHGFEVIHVATGEEAIEIADKNRSLDLILMDIDLGEGIDGTEAAEIILTKHDLPLVFLSSHTEPEIVEKTEGITSYGYVVKNTGETVLMASIKMAFRLHNAHLKVEDHSRKLEKINKDLLRSKNEYRILFDSAPSAVYIVQDNYIREINSAGEKITGYSAEVLKSQPFTDFIYPDDIPTVVDRHRRRLKGENVENGYLIRILNSKSELLWIELFSTVIIWDDKPATLNYVKDVTKQKEAEERLQIITDNMFDLVALTDLQGNFTFAGRSHSILGYDIYSLIGKNVIEMVHEDDLLYVQQGFNEWLESGLGTRRVEYRIRCVDGSYLWLETLGKLIKDDNGNIKELLFSSRDITGRKQAEENIKMLLKESHHRVKNNMNTIYGLLMLQAEKDGNAGTDSILTTAAGQLKSMITLYDKMYRSSEYSNINIQDYLNQLINEIVGLFSIHIPVETKISIEDFVLSVDIVSPLSIIINELITNTMKHAFTGKDKGLITVTAAKNDNLITISYSDNGKGLPESFYTEESNSFGIELVHMLVKQIKGTLKIDKGDGAGFLIEFEA